MRLKARKLFFLPSDIVKKMSGKRAQYEPPRGDVYIGSGNFIKQGKHQFNLLKKHMALLPEDHLLDIGSGIGRTAAPLTQFLNKNGSYCGFDVVEKGVKWCNENIHRDFSNFNFIFAPLNNDLYNNCEEKADKFTFPYPKNSFNKAFLFSVFTHMKIEEIQNYLCEIKRVLQPSGLCLATFFIYNQKNENQIATREGFQFPIKKEGFRLMDEKVQAANIAIDEVLLDKMIATAGLLKIKMIDGFWKDFSLKNADIDFQDVVILKKES